MTGHVHRNFMLMAAIAPPLGLVTAVVLLWNELVGPAELILFVALYFFTAVGISVGYHRMLAHRSFKAKKPVRLVLALAGTLAAQGPAITWAAHHRKHHKLADKDGDPHSPHDHDAHGVWGLLKGFWHAHMGWLFDETLTSEPMRFTPDLVREKELRWMSRHFVALVYAGIIMPGLIAFAVTQEPLSLLTGALWGGIVRIFLLDHVTWAINSLGHIVGKRSFRTSDHSRNLPLIAVPSLGEGYHNNHHAFPNSAILGVRRHDLDLGYLLILGLERLGLVWDVVRPKPARMESKAITPRRPETGMPADVEEAGATDEDRDLAPFAGAGATRR
jgi:stearoyl-CoA desaturase (Delta-9 desaturase)